MNNNITCTKRFADYPFAHRQPTHDGHCALIHGHNWDFEVTFAARALDDNGFVFDFGKLGFIKESLASMFDHTLVLPQNDPELKKFKALEADKLCKLTILPEASAEGLAMWLLGYLNGRMTSYTNGRVFVTQVTVYEDKKNSATARL